MAKTPKKAPIKKSVKLSPIPTKAPDSPANLVSEMFELFLYWIMERHMIYLKRQAGLPKPWTTDTVLQYNFFTSPYRELDKTTVWFRENIRDPLRNDDRVLMATIIFRWFNFIPSATLMMGTEGYDIPQKKAKPIELAQSNLFINWNTEECIRRLKDMPKHVTGAYIINTAAAVQQAGIKKKLEGVCWNIDQCWPYRDMVLKMFKEAKTLEEGQRILDGRFPGLAGFMTYEIISDLRYTALLDKATDINTWANPGPGARRGLNRLFGRDVDDNSKTDNFGALQQFLGEMRALLPLVNYYLRTVWPGQARSTSAPGLLTDPLPLFEMREIEHSLCEFDKYMRVKRGEGASKRGFQGAK